MRGSGPSLGGSVPGFAALTLARAVKRATGKVSEDESNNGVGDEARVAWSGGPVLAQLICIGGKHEGENREEQSGDLKPDDAAGVDDGFPDGLAKFAGAAGDSLAAVGVHLRQRRGLLLIFLAGSFGTRGLLTGLSCALHEHSGGHAEADSEFAADGVRLHKKSLAACSNLPCRLRTSEVM